MSQKINELEKKLAKIEALNALPAKAEKSLSEEFAEKRAKATMSLLVKESIATDESLLSAKLSTKLADMRVNSLARRMFKAGVLSVYDLDGGELESQAREARESAARIEAREAASTVKAEKATATVNTRK